MNEPSLSVPFIAHLLQVYLVVILMLLLLLSGPDEELQYNKYIYNRLGTTQIGRSMGTG